MKAFFASTAVIALLTGKAMALDIYAESLITGATVYPSGATITRTVNFNAPAGGNTVFVDDLPLNFDASSLRVTGSGDTTFRIISVNHRINRLPPVAPDESAEYKRIEAELEVLQNRLTDLIYQRKVFTAQAEVADGRLLFVDLLMKREPQKLVDDLEQKRVDPTAWGQTIDVLAQQMQVALTSKNNAEKEMLGIDELMDELREDIADKTQELGATQLPLPPRSVASVEIAADTAISGNIQISYRIDTAGWEPVYDLRLEQNAQATLQIDRHARIYQATGEAWDNIGLTLSTARPSNRMDTPELYEQLAALVDVNARFGSKVELSKDRERAVFSPELGLAQSEALQDTAMSEPVMLQEAFTNSATLETRGQTVVYRLSEPADISGDGTVRQMTIDSASLGVGILARATPQLDTNAYMYAAITNGFGGPILPGRASAFRDGTFIGETWMPLTAAGAKATVPFGVLDGIKITRHVLEKEDGDFGIIGTTNRRIERFEMTAKSVLPYDIALTLYDQAPFSENEDLLIKTYARPQASETDFEGKRGVQSWTMDVKPGSKHRIEFGFEIQWPGDQSIIFPQAR